MKEVERGRLLWGRCSFRACLVSPPAVCGAGRRSARGREQQFLRGQFGAHALQAGACFLGGAVSSHVF